MLLKANKTNTYSRINILINVKRVLTLIDCKVIGFFLTCFLSRNKIELICNIVFLIAKNIIRFFFFYIWAGKTRVTIFLELEIIKGESKLQNFISKNNILITLLRKIKSLPE